jgi:ParB-like chromosome segregation protein Spo0J
MLMSERPMGVGRSLILRWYHASMTNTLRISSVALADLTPFEGNARRGDVDKIAESLFANGQYKPIVVNRGTHTKTPNEVLAGNHTVEAAKSLGWQKIQVVFVDVDRSSAVRINVADNRTSDIATDDTSALIALLQSLEQLDGTGFTDDDLTALVASLDDSEADLSDGDADVEDFAQSFGVVIECKNERQQSAMLDRFIAEGLEVRALS